MVHVNDVDDAMGCKTSYCGITTLRFAQAKDLLVDLLPFFEATETRKMGLSKIGQLSFGSCLRW